VGPLNVPAHVRVPSVAAVHLQKMRRAHSASLRGRLLWNPTPVSLCDFVFVCIYALKAFDPVYRLLLKNGMRGISLVYHEMAELQALLDWGIDPFKLLDRRRSGDPAELAAAEAVYARAHPVGLVAEHRYLQGRPGAGAFTLAELVYWNPLVDGRLDLRYLQQNPPSNVTPDDMDIRPGLRGAVENWYRDKGFLRGCQ